MIEITNTEVMGWEAAIRGMRNPMNSWKMSDSSSDSIGEKDRDLMERLSNAGTDHRKFMRMITVYLDINAPLYWWKEYDTYKVGTVANSCSTMHKIQAKEFVLDDFSHDHLNEESIKRVLEPTIEMLNEYRLKFIETKDKDYWWQMIQLLPSSYNQKRTVLLNYEVLANIYKSRKGHKLDEWRTFCEWIKTLPLSHIITHED
ncbi:MAG: hypothetical protein ACI4WM_04690 [Erysipelotrichaceae bacterium]